MGVLRYRHSHKTCGVMRVAGPCMGTTAKRTSVVKVTAEPRSLKLMQIILKDNWPALLVGALDHKWT